jgi:hypothetical protein
MINFRITITGTADLLMHNSRLANPLDPTSKAIKRISGKRNKTDDDYEEMARLEHAGALYIDADTGPYIPGDNIWRCLHIGATKNNLGEKVKPGVFISTDINPVAYTGPRDVAGLWKDENFRLWASVKIGTKRIMRCRPVFRQWRTQADGILDPTQLDFVQLEQIADTAGSIVGLGDWRPRYGRFTATVEQIR